MDLLQQCAQEFEYLTAYQYHMIAGRKGKLIEFTISFDPSDFHHLAGLHKLRDHVRFRTGKRSDIFSEILSGKLTLFHAQQSTYFSDMMSRLEPLASLESFLDSNDIIFRYNPKIQAFSLINADYLLENKYKGNPVYLFLSQRAGHDSQVCRTFFPKTDRDYTTGQPRYTLLKKEKRNIMTGETVIQYDKLSH